MAAWSQSTHFVNARPTLPWRSSAERPDRRSPKIDGSHPKGLAACGLHFRRATFPEWEPHHHRIERDEMLCQERCRALAVVFRAESRWRAPCPFTAFGPHLPCFGLRPGGRPGPSETIAAEEFSPRQGAPRGAKFLSAPVLRGAAALRVRLPGLAPHRSAVARENGLPRN